MKRQKATRITFTTEAYLARFLLELARWGVRDTRWNLGVNDLSVVTKDTNVIDVCTETFMFANRAYKIEKIVKCAKCPRALAPHGMQDTYPDLCTKCADDLAQHMNDMRPAA